ncbi:MAG TPA: DUF4252 domain-containing protein [Gammaproteobacteria bacterium]|nr:DUF4252 domain-containing protein [Gammaproteobacteria bacterium]
MTTRLSFAATALLTLCGAARAQNGYFDFGQIPGLDAEPTVQIDLNPMMLGWVTQAAKQDDPEAAKAIASLKGVRVLVYENIDASVKAVSQFIADASRKLEGDGWQRTVYVHDGDDNVRIYMKPGDPKAPKAEIAGFVVMVVDDSDAVFINVAGPLDPEQLGRLTGGLGWGGMLNGFIGGSRNHDEERDHDR